jgi:hypothetical protein
MAFECSQSPFGESFDYHLAAGLGVRVDCLTGSLCETDGSCLPMLILVMAMYVPMLSFTRQKT